MAFYVYILYSSYRNKYYVGHTEDLKNRIREHNEGRSYSTKGGSPWELKYYEEFSTRADAMVRERQIKMKKRKSYIEWLIDKNT